MSTNDPASPSRRRFLYSAGVTTAAAVWLGPQRLFAQHEGAEIVNLMRAGAATANIEVQALRGNVSVLMGSGGNIAVLPGPDGKLLIDAGITGSRAAMTKALAAISADPIKQLINTHWHFDHTDGNEWLHAEGATILAHENTRKHLSTATRVEGWDHTFPAAPPGALPTDVFSTDRTLRMNGANLALAHYEPAHTDSDISVHFTDTDVIHVGDTWWNGVYPFIDYSTGGSIDGTIRAVEHNLAKVSATTVIIPGHGPVGNRSQLVEYRDMLVTTRDTVAALKKQGRTIDEVLAAKPTAAYDAKWGNLIVPRLFIRTVYVGV
jgi:glyoxylase-like metal-dependent hydrolase (beta-lactamase superfamily II)